MAEVEIKIQFYRNENNKEPVKEWLQEQNKDIKKSVGTKINVVQGLLSKKERISRELMKKIADNIYEIRIKNIRVFIAYIENRIILLHIVVKKRNDIAKTDKNIAIKRLKEILNKN